MTKDINKFMPRSMAALLKKELYSYSISPAFYGIAIFFLLFTTIWLFNLQGFFQRDEASLRLYFAAFPIVFILVIPAITMRLWAEERKVGSDEMLLTLPASEWALVLAKYLAALIGVAVILVFSLSVPLSLSPLGNFDGGVIFTEYLGALFLASSAIALGALLSSLSKNQTAAFLGSVVVLLIIMLINQLPWLQDMPPLVNDFVRYLSLSFHFESFSKGLIDSRDAMYFILTSFLFLFLNTRVLLFRKWN